MCIYGIELLVDAIAVEQGKSLSRWVTELIEKNTDTSGVVDAARKHALKTVKRGMRLGTSDFSRANIYE